MRESREDLVNPSRRLPDLALPTTEGSRYSLRGPRRESLVLVLLHEDCAACSRYAARLALERHHVEAWETKLLQIGGGVAGLPRAQDPGGRLAGALKVEPPAVVAADRWGELYEAKAGGPEHRLPGPDEIAGWARYLAIQCPECQGEAY